MAAEPPRRPAVPPRRRWRVTGADVRGALWSLVSTAAGLGLAMAVVPGASAASVWSLLLASLAVGVGDVALRPLLRQVALRLGAVGALVAGVVAQLLVAWLALSYLPGIRADSWTDVLAVFVVAAVFMAVGRWAVGASDNEYVLGDLARRARRTRRGVPAGRGAEAEAGLLVVQLDGLARPTLDHALQAGLAPNLARWLGSGTHRLETWWARVPATTPASQAGLLHGTSEHVPAFRWWDRGLGRLVVTNRPDDAALVESRASDGAGLLAGGGVAVSTMFSGDAATSLLVMSRARSGIGPGQMFVHFFSSPFVLVRALLGTAGEFVKELYQGWQQASRGVEPRVSRLGAYPVLRATTNVILRDLNTSLVAEQLVRGAPVIFVDLVDYDEIAHHAGPLRPESLRALEGLDRVVGLWEEVARLCPRRYEIVVLSDHGQSLGTTFDEVVGRSFLAEVRRLMALPEEAPDRRRPAPSAPDREEWGSVNTALNAFGRSDDARVLVGPDRRTADRAADRAADRTADRTVDRTAEGRAARARVAGTGPDDPPEVAVVGSGNLGMVWFPRSPRTVDGEEIRARWPALLPGLLANPAVGVVVVREGPDVVASGPAGSRDLGSGRVTGDDPLAPYGPRASADLLRVVGLENSGDLVLISSLDDVGMVHAFEGLVGSHGGLGGAQNEAVLVHPAHLSVPDAERQDVGTDRMLVGAEAVHRRLVLWLRDLGIREGEGVGGAQGADAAGTDGSTDGSGAREVGTHGTRDAGGPPADGRAASGRAP